MDDYEYESLSYSKWECKYHVVFVPKCRRKTLYGECEKAPRVASWRSKRKPAANCRERDSAVRSIPST
jgi:REP element-mobilizing transposase RayT